MEEPPSAVHKAGSPVLTVIQGDKKCGTCKHFDKEQWARAMAQNPVFAQATQWVSPNVMGSTVERDDQGNPLREEEPALDLKEDDWGLFAVCTKKGSPHYGVGLHQSDNCDLWESAS